MAETETDSVTHKYREQKIAAQTNQRKQEVSEFALASFPKMYKIETVHLYIYE